MGCHHGNKPGMNRDRGSREPPPASPLRQLSTGSSDDRLLPLELTAKASPASTGAPSRRGGLLSPTSSPRQDLPKS